MESLLVLVRILHRQIGSTVMLNTVGGASWIWNWGSCVVTFAEPPAAEQVEEADQGRSDQCDGGGEDPVVERDLLSQLLGLLGHGFQFVE